MRDEDNILLARDEVGQFSIVTVFLGFNNGSVENPQFFQTTCFGSDTGSPKYTKDWDWAMAHHQGKIACAKAWIKFSEEKAAGIDRSFRFVDCQVHPPGEIHFLLESEAEAKRVMPFNKRHWERRGRTIVFLVRPCVE
ncbi:MAG: hypothetical protein AAF821_18825 [Cyanobacteria bacterium P01_D01_bin.156]